MPGEHNFEHLPLLLRERGPARLSRPPAQSPQTIANRNARRAHSEALLESSRLVTATWRQRRAEREAIAGEQGLPVLPRGVPILLQVDPSLDLDVLREKFAFEIVAEQEEGYVIVASEDIEIAPFVAMVNAFAVQIRGSATIASVHQLRDDPNQIERLRRILSDSLFDEWPRVRDGQDYVVDVGVACSGTREIPKYPVRAKRDGDAGWAKKQLDWSRARNDAYNAWDELRTVREDEITRFVESYGAQILHLVDGAPFDSAVLPDSFTVRLRIVGKGLRDFVLNYPYIFEVVEPDDIVLPQREGQAGRSPAEMAAPTAPDPGAPAVCVIDSGIQEAHVLIEPAIDHPTFRCFLPGCPPTDVGDLVRPNGHGTRVAGAILYGESVPESGRPQLPYWIQNARVLDGENRMPVAMPPPEVVRRVVEQFCRGPRHTRVFNHSVNANSFCRQRYMSAWAAEIDSLCEAYDILVIQSAGNLPLFCPTPHLGIRDHLAAGRDYPTYLHEPSTRIANPAQSLQALTVGSVAYGFFESGGWRTFAQERGGPSAFSRSGPGIWDVIKPEVVEYGGDNVRTRNLPPEVQVGGQIPDACPMLVRSTAFGAGPAFARDDAGTSFAAPKVARIAARLVGLLPAEPALLYRALIVQSAHWPQWAERLLTELRRYDPGDPFFGALRRGQLLDEVSQIIRCIGYGLPDETRATSNTNHRTTFITSGETSIRAGECHIYQVPIPSELRRPADEFDIRIDVTLSYVAQPRRTRRNLRRYLSTWLDWKSGRLGETIGDFRLRALKEEGEVEAAAGSGVPWTLQHSSAAGLVRNTRRSNGTVQKDWAIVKSNRLPDDLCIAVVGHRGWSSDPDSIARYSLVVTLEIIGQEIPIYEPLRAAVTELREIVEAQVAQEVVVEVEE